MSKKSNKKIEKNDVLPVPYVPEKKPSRMTDKELEKALKEILSDMKNEAKEKNEKKKSDTFYTTAFTSPIENDVYIDALCCKYGIGAYDGKSLLWYEEEPSRKKEKKNLEKWKKNHSFDYREIWNLDSCISLYLYPRMKSLSKNCGYYENPAKMIYDYKTYQERVIKPILKGLELHLIFSVYDAGYHYIDKWVAAHGRHIQDDVDINAYIKKQTERSYILIAEHLNGFWT